MQKRVITIQDISCIGRCSLTVALPILSAAGIETSILPTAILSTHTGGFTGYTFRDLTDDIEPIAAHWKTLDINVDGIYTGYLGSHRQLELMARFFDEFRQNDTLVMVDPAMADQGMLYPGFDNDFALGMRDLCKKADLIVPNMTEACLMLEKPYPAEGYSEEFVDELLEGLASLGPSKVVLTGISYTPDRIGAIAYDVRANSRDSYFSERIEGYYHGTGDIYSSSLLAAIMNDKSLAESIKIAVEYTLGCIKRTHAADTDRKFGVDFESGLGDFARAVK